MVKHPDKTRYLLSIPGLRTGSGCQQIAHDQGAQHLSRGDGHVYEACFLHSPYDLQVRKFGHNILG